jgi:hypothetical protein
MSRLRVTASTRAAIAILSLLTGSVGAGAQVQSKSDDAASEDLEPRIIGKTGTTMIGLGGYVDRFSSPERTSPLNYTAQIDVSRFVTQKFVVSAGLAGSGAAGGDESEDLPTGSGAPALHAFGGLLYYFRPQSILSFYSGGEYWAQLTRRANADAGSIVAKAGLQGAVSSRASFFLEAGYGLGLTQDEDGDVLSRIVGRVGIRLKFRD